MTAFKSAVFCLIQIKDNEKNYQTGKRFLFTIKDIKGFYSLSDCTPALKCRMTAFKSLVLCSLYF